jgi:purine-binding chemotaxis protein CheW
MQASPRPASQPGIPVRADERSGKYLTFKLGPEEFGVRVLKVREIMAMQQITVVPQMPDYMKGLISLRGKAIPVIDLRLKFVLPAVEYTSRTCIIVVEVESEAGPINVGLVVDAVSSVLDLMPADIENHPDSVARLGPSFILGTAKVKGKTKILLDIDRVASTRDIPGFDALVERA